MVRSIPITECRVRSRTGDLEKCEQNNKIHWAESTFASERASVYVTASTVYTSNTLASCRCNTFRSLVSIESVVSLVPRGQWPCTQEREEKRREEKEWQSVKPRERERERRWKRRGEQWRLVVASSAHDCKYESVLFVSSQGCMCDTSVNRAAFCSPFNCWSNNWPEEGGRGERESESEKEKAISLAQVLTLGKLQDTMVKKRHLTLVDARKRSLLTKLSCSRLQVKQAHEFSRPRAHWCLWIIDIKGEVRQASVAESFILTTNPLLAVFSLWTLFLFYLFLFFLLSYFFLLLVPVTLA